MSTKEMQLFSHQVVQKLIELLPVHVFWKDAAGVYLGCNNLFAHGIGLDSAADVVGKTDYDLPVEKEMSDLYRQDDRFVMDSKLPKLNIEEKQTLLNGKECFLLTSKVPIFSNNGLVVGVLGVYIDITEKKNYENALIKSKEKAKAANRAKAEFLANMSHDMLSPLSGILLAAEAISTSKELPEEAIEMGGMISASSKQLKKFFTSCLELSKLEMEEWVSAKSTFSVRRLAQDIYDLYLPKAVGSGLSLSIFCDPNLPEAVEGHHDSLYRALLNLTGNALKFTTQGSVTIRALCGDEVDDDYLTIILEVEDTGMGIPEDKFKVIFEKLQRLTPAYSSNIEGSGIGLYIVDQFIKRMGGHISVQSEVGKGSIFTVLVPVRIIRQD